MKAKDPTVGGAEIDRFCREPRKDGLARRHLRQNATRCSAHGPELCAGLFSWDATPAVTMQAASGNGPTAAVSASVLNGQHSEVRRRTRDEKTGGTAVRSGRVRGYCSVRSSDADSRCTLT